MKINSIKLSNYRNYKNSTINFADGINFIVGKNAQGKTNLIESIYFCALGKSPKNLKEKLLINYDADNAYINLDFTTRAGNKKIDIMLNTVGKKTVKINRIPISKLTQLIGELNIVYFSPDELKLVKEVPEDRRRFLDISISQFDKSYLFNLIKYDKILKQRNCVLKEYDSKENKINKLNIWTPQLINTAEIIIKKRIEFINKLKIIANKIHKNIINTENLDIEYSFLSNYENIKNDLINIFKTNIDKEIEAGHTLFGPQRDDVIFKINGKDCRYFCSQGQQRTVALSLKLSIMEIIKNEIGEYPVLLLDDVMSELDLSRKNNLLDIIKNYQTIISCAENLDAYKNYNIIKIENGRQV